MYEVHQQHCNKVKKWENNPILVNKEALASVHSHAFNKTSFKRISFFF